MTPLRTLSLALAIMLPMLNAPAQQSDSPNEPSPVQALTVPDEQVLAQATQTRVITPAAPTPDNDTLVGLAELPESVAPALPAIEGKGIDDNLLPLRLPGYELRVLDKRKKMLYNIKGQWVEASLPVYFYYPTEPANKDRALQLLRKVYDDVLALGEKPQWTAAEFRNVLVSLDSALSLLEAGSADNKTAPAPAK